MEFPSKKVWGYLDQRGEYFSYKKWYCCVTSFLVLCFIQAVAVACSFKAEKQLDLRMKHSSAAISTGNTFQNLPRLRETADNTERYI
jgi:hypothetical protein